MPTSVIGLTFVVVILLVFVRPQLDQISDGTLSARYSVVELTGRGRIMAEDFVAWLAHPWFGIGAWQVKYWHKKNSGKASAARTRETPHTRAITAMFVIWAVLYMTVNAMRIAAPAICLAICLARLFPLQTPQVYQQPAELVPCPES